MSKNNILFIFGAWNLQKYYFLRVECYPIPRSTLLKLNRRLVRAKSNSPKHMIPSIFCGLQLFLVRKKQIVLRAVWLMLLSYWNVLIFRN